MLNRNDSSDQITFGKIDDAQASTRRGALPTLPIVELNILRGQARQKVRRVQVPVFLIGAALDCDLVLRDSRLPEVHTYLYVTRDAVSVRHLGPAPLLFVGDEPVETAQLHHGNVVRIGDAYEFSISIQSLADVAPQDTPRILRWDAAQKMVRHAGVSNRQVLLSPN